MSFKDLCFRPQIENMIENKFNSVQELMVHVEDEALRRIEKRLKETSDHVTPRRQKDESAIMQMSGIEKNRSRSSEMR